MRVSKYLASTTGLSRRESDNAISSGRVTVDGEKAVLGAQMSPDSVIALDGKPVQSKGSFTYLMLNKPVGYLCSRRSQGGAPTIYELLPEKYRRLKAVGRLDKDSSGLILLTDDGDFAFLMTHPKFHKTKVYEVELDKPLEPLHQQMISDYGITLEDGVSKFIIEKLDREKGLADEQIADDRNLAGNREQKNEPQHTSRQIRPSYKITMSEGRNRQIRRTFAALGYTVTKLHRTHFGKYSLGSVKNGELKLTSNT